MYIFSSNESDRNVIISNTSSGGICCNDTVMHLAGKRRVHSTILIIFFYFFLLINFYLVDTLPFGGVGPSGMGAYHGKYSFDTFVHKRSCLVKKIDTIGEKLSK